jgi:outer membrane protein assembly factor BamE (lipoprotein component of BamABCDE complex)
MLADDVQSRLLAALGVLLTLVLAIQLYERVRRSLAQAAAEADLAKLLPGMTREEIVSLLGRPSHEPTADVSCYDYGWGIRLEVTLDDRKLLLHAIITRS